MDLIPVFIALGIAFAYCIFLMYDCGVRIRNPIFIPQKLPENPVPQSAPVSTPIIPADQVLSLDMAWLQAEEYGRPELKQEHNRKEYAASITFDTKAGSTLWARGKGPTALKAMLAALREAQNLQAGVILANS
jgi:hypothetical protein